MKCPRCGQELEEGAKFCNNCGEAILPEPAEIKEETPAEETAEAVTEETEPEKKYEDIKSHRGQLIMTAEEAEEVERKALERRKDRKEANKALRWILLAGVVIACFLTFNNAPDARVKRVVNEAETLVEAGDYNGAMDKYVQALEFRPGDEEISKSANEVLQEVGMNMVNSGQYEELKELCDKLLPLMAPDQQQWTQLFGQMAYISLKFELTDKGDMEGAKALIQEGIDKGFDLQSELEYLN